MEILVVERITELMDTEHINQSALAEKLDVDQSTISLWLNGKTEPSITSLWLLADYFDVTVDYLIGRTEFY